VPVLELVPVFVVLVEPDVVLEINAEYEAAGEEVELLERVALFVLDALFCAVLVTITEAELAIVFPAEKEYPEERVLVLEAKADIVGATGLIPSAQQYNKHNKKSLIAFTTRYIKLKVSKFTSPIYPHPML